MNITRQTGYEQRYIVTRSRDCCHARAATGHVQLLA